MHANALECFCLLIKVLVVVTPATLRRHARVVIRALVSHNLAVAVDDGVLGRCIVFVSLVIKIRVVVFVCPFSIDAAAVI